MNKIPEQSPPQYLHKHKHDESFQNALSEYDIAIKLAINSGATRPDSLKRRIPNGRCEIEYITIQNIAEPILHLRTDHVFWSDIQCNLCGEDNVRMRLRENETELKDVVALLRVVHPADGTNEIIMRKDWSWQLLRQDAGTSLMALYSKKDRPSLWRRLDRWFSNFAYGFSKYIRAYYIEDYLPYGCDIRNPIPFSSPPISSNGRGC